VKIGFNDGSKVEIIDGIATDTPVVLIGKRPLSDGQTLQVTEAK